MKTIEETQQRAEATIAAAGDQLLPRLDGARMSEPLLLPGIVVGELLGLRERGRVALVTYAGRLGQAAVAARSVIELHSAQIGHQVALAFENGDPANPLIIGVLTSEGWPLEDRPEHVEIEADGARLIVSAREQLTLRCGAASITLTREGEVTIKGTRLSSQSSGVNRIKGGSVELN
jgi:Domain of unknown function (DUF6484)